MLTGARSQGVCLEKQCSVWLMACWEGAGQLLKAPPDLLLLLLLLRVGRVGVEGGYFHDPISIREAKLFMPSA